MHSHTINRLTRAILIDLRLGQSTASSIAERIHVDTVTVERIAATMLEEKLVETRTVAGVLTVYRATTKGLLLIA